MNSYSRWREPRRAVRGADHGDRRVGGRDVQRLTLCARSRTAVDLVISDAHEDLKAAVAKVLKTLAALSRPTSSARWWLMLANRDDRSSPLSARFAQERFQSCSGSVGAGRRPVRLRMKKLAELVDEAEAIVLAL